MKNAMQQVYKIFSQSASFGKVLLIFVNVFHCFCSILIKKTQSIMRSHCIFIFLLWLQCFRLSYAAGPVHPDDPDSPETVDPPPEEPGPSPNESPNSSGEGSNGGVPKANVPGAIAQGEAPEVSPEDNEIDIDEIAEKLKDLVEDISSLVDALTQTSTSTDSNGSPTTIAYPTITNALISGGAAFCTDAQSAYAVCSSANSNFSALPQTQQAGCLCNAQPMFDLNSNMKGCYSWANGQNGTNATQFQSYASAIANATSLCAPCPATSIADLPGASNVEVCPGPSPTSAPPPPTQPPTLGGAGGGGLVEGSSCYLLLMAFWIALTSALL